MGILYLFMESLTLIVNSTDKGIIDKYTNVYQYSSDIGIDLFTPEKYTIQPREKVCIDLGIKCQLVQSQDDVGYMLVPRSSIHKYGLMLCNSIGIIDPGYRGNLMAFVWNYTDSSVVVEKHSRLFQIVSFTGQKMKVDTNTIVSSSERGTNGFGSTGN